MMIEKVNCLNEDEFISFPKHGDLAGGLKHVDTFCIFTPTWENDPI